MSPAHTGQKRQSSNPDIRQDCSGKRNEDKQRRDGGRNRRLEGQGRRGKGEGTEVESSIEGERMWRAMKGNLCAKRRCGRCSQAGNYPLQRDKEIATQK